MAILAAYLPFEEFVLKWVPLSLYTPLRFLGEITILLLVSVYLVDRVIIKHKWTKTPIDLSVISLVIVIILSTFFNHIPVLGAALGVKNLLRYIALYYLVILIEPSEEQIIQLMRVLFILAVVQSAIAVGQSVIGKPAYDFFTPRDVVVGGQVIRSSDVEKLAFGSYRTMVFGTMGRYNFLGNYLAMWLGFAGTVLIFKHHPLKIHIGQVVLLITAFLLSYSRMSWLGLVGGMILLFLVSRKNKHLAYLMIGFIVIFTITGWLIVRDSLDTYAIDAGQGSPLARYVDLFSSEYLEILFTSGRGYSYFSIVPAVLRIHPFLGLGPGVVASDVLSLVSFSSSLSQLNLSNTYALRYLGDAGFAAIIAQLGLLGLVSVLLIFAQLFRTGLRFTKLAKAEWRSIAFGYVACVAMMVIFNLAAFALIYRVPGYYFWMFSAFVVLQNKRSRARETESEELIC